MAKDDLRINRDTPKPKSPAEMAKPGPGVDNRLRAEKRKGPKSRSTTTPKGGTRDVAASLAKVQADAKAVVATERAVRDGALHVSTAPKEPNVAQLRAEAKAIEKKLAAARKTQDRLAELEAKHAEARQKSQAAKDKLAAAKKAGIKGYSKMNKGDLQSALKKGPAGWSDAAREASAKARADAKPGKAKVPKGKIKGKGGALGIAIAAGAGLYALTQGASPAAAAEASADVVTGGGVSNYKANRKAGDSMAWAGLKSGVQAVADLASGFAVTHYQDARSRGVSQGKAVVSAAVGSANTMALGLPSAIGEMAASPESQKRRASMKGKFRQAGGYQAAAARLAMQRNAQPSDAATPDGWVAAYTRHVDGKTQRVGKRRQTAKELARR